MGVKMSETWLAVCCTILSLLVLLFFALRSFRDGSPSAQAQDGGDSRVYGLQHGILNLHVPPRSMWMNMGYWKNQFDDPHDLPRACEALLVKVMSSAFTNKHSGSSKGKEICILDAGFGCGDQTEFLLRLNNSKQHSLQQLPRLSSYVGITIDRKQYSYAVNHLRSSGFIHGPTKSTSSTVGVKLYLADAGKPESWTQELQQDTRALCQTNDQPQTAETWLLGLDTMYHFAPSRLPLLRYACQEVNASLMAFDILLDDRYDQAGILPRFLVWLFCKATSTPYHNLMTSDQYKNLLVQAGYERQSVEIEDISEWVFDPLVRFLERQNDYLKMIGLGIKRFAVAGWVFKWWARSKIVKGCVVVARK